MAIRFSCKCGYKFELPDEEAGGVIQCDKCGLLNDIPRHQDLDAITDDGVYKLDEEPVLDNPEAAAELIYIYSRGARDVFGDEKDMRTTDEELIEARGQTVPIDEPVRVDVPKYDPETGELIDEFDLAKPSQYAPDPASIPMAKAALSYATGAVPREPSMVRGFGHMFSAPNLAVMGAIFLMHAFLWPLQFVVSAGIFFLGVGIPPVLLAIISHYGNVVEDLGPHEKDDFPRPLRDLEFHGDIWWPFCNLFGSLLMCYWPLMPLSLVLVAREDLPRMVPVLLISIVAGLGTVAFPAVLLTLVGSGTGLNLRPDRLLKVMSQCGAAYFYTTVVWVAAGGTYMWGFVGTALAVASAMNMASGSHWYLRWRILVPMVLVGIILMHYFCYCVAMLYRKHHEEFPWVLQRHVREYQPVVAPPNRPGRKPRPAQVKPR